MPFAVSLLLLGVLWELSARGAGSFLLPPLSSIAVRWLELVQTGELPTALGLAAIDLLLGFALSMVVGIPLGLAIGRFQRVEDLLDVHLTIVLVTPIAALVPLVVIFLGFGFPARIFLIFLFAVIMPVINTAAGVRSTNPRLIEMARSLGASEAQLFLKVMLPAAVPAMMTGVRLALGRAVLGTLMAEWLFATYALGEMLLVYQAKFEVDAVFATVFTVIAAAVLLLSAVDRIERRLGQWRPVAAIK
ncbi:MAG: ABC transporter permease [Deltaproteobacteria bacterium]|nr:ABC transporter permease [Deltaproteobacteria bacterium]